ncbi:erythromycin esterase-like protein [Actinoplanes lutulentus]|uniref:Erythromycin esterase-like protein n=1 Tax=Actinoplanes lutulentus TaxID=1287878 RepID=A0A327YYL2_9ACTN|nr:erythromycin esterase family protein [Actinoplanes lutulentus]MBB2943498.1 erythromycin esterase-like protein [Actinoplanes lutulentus]RAK25983.1 erythromycin esterase-like protein [Actinoplanes lutulentus]
MNLSLLPKRPRLLGLGEPTHGENDLLDLRNEIFRELVEHEGYRIIAIESDCLMGLVVDDYVTSGIGVLDEVMARGFSHEWGAFAGNRDLVRWMREHNDGRPAAEQVRFAGFDGPLEITGAASPRQALTALHGYLPFSCTLETLDRLLGADERWLNPAAMMDPAQSVGQTAEATELRVLADEMLSLVEAQTPQLMAEGRWHRATLYGRTAIGLLRYHYGMADTSPSRIAKLLGVRDSMMAANLLALAAQGPTLVYAHNSHLQRPMSSMRMGGDPVRWWSAGAIVEAQLADDYAFITTALGTIHHRGVGVPPEGTIEALLYARPEDHCLVDPKSLAGSDFTARVSPWFGYAALDPAQLNAVDGILFLKDARER